MSTNSQPDDRTVKKDVSLTAYTDRYDDGQSRDFLAALLSQLGWDGDAFEEKETTSKQYYVVFGGDPTDNDARLEINKRRYQRLSEQRDTADFDLGDVSFHVNRETETKKQYSIHSLKGEVGGHLAETLPDEIAGLTRQSELGGLFNSSKKWVDPSDETDTHARISASKPTMQQVLVHQQKRTPDARFESEMERLALDVSVSMEADQPVLIDRLSEEIVKPLHDRLSNLDGVLKVRLADCKTVEENYGECYDL